MGEVQCGVEPSDIRELRLDPECLTRFRRICGREERLLGHPELAVDPGDVLRTAPDVDRPGDLITARVDLRDRPIEAVRDPHRTAPDRHGSRPRADSNRRRDGRRGRIDPDQRVAGRDRPDGTFADGNAGRDVREANRCLHARAVDANNDFSSACATHTAPSPMAIAVGPPLPVATESSGRPARVARCSTPLRVGTQRPRWTAAVEAIACEGCSPSRGVLTRRCRTRG